MYEEEEDGRWWGEGLGYGGERGWVVVGGEGMGKERGF